MDSNVTKDTNKTKDGSSRLMQVLAVIVDNFLIAAESNLMKLVLIIIYFSYIFYQLLQEQPLVPN